MQVNACSALSIADIHTLIDYLISSPRGASLPTHEPDHGMWTMAGPQASNPKLLPNTTSGHHAVLLEMGSHAQVTI